LSHNSSLPEVTGGKTESSATNSETVEPAKTFWLPDWGRIAGRRMVRCELLDPREATGLVSVWDDASRAS
jgi:hypothetical protein